METDTDSKNEANYGSRKFVLALVVIFLGVGMSLTGHLTPELVELMKWVSAMYFGMNVTQKAAEWITSKVAGK